MSRRPLHPVSTWVLWVLGLPLALLCLGIVLVVTTEVGELPFDNPELWWLSGAVPLASLFFLYGLMRRRSALRRFASETVAPLLAVRMSPTRQAIRAGLCVVAVVMLVVAILGPRWGIYLEKQKVYGVDVVVAVDLSRSMLASDVEPNRLERAKREIRQQLTERAVFRRAHRLGLMAFAGTTKLRAPLTTDHLSFRSKLEGLRVGSIARGGTAIADAIRDCADLFAKSPEKATKVILLFTDGEDHEGGPVEAANEVYEEQGIRVFTIGVGDPARTVGAEVPADSGGSSKPLLHDGQIVFSKMDVASLRRIAEAGNGQFAPVSDFHVLIDAISDMWQTELSTEERQRHRPRYQWFVALALVFLGLETLISERRPGADELKRVWQQEASA
ncbi:MAG: VWA domain-containing protein [Phycisphaerales bacterium]|nr:MAG: VWA domain-containing protein [Phycisphaerales bacterium]